MSGKRPLIPEKPVDMDIVYYYKCPFCQRKVPLIAPSQPSMGQCDACHKQFPVVPADECTLVFIKTILDYGQAGIDPNYI